ncbi:Electron transport complex subunit RsxC [Zhongshania aliphaticivorans]|uniref:Ion-translocating oxidoreductase complex subunit C n=1 Tax=Zhongshania aliphaticivorans TaxID=1470434 RepID=A0A5S9N1V9_9GAMM|nr:electron transport complex subunit RsxC [Zhongshania aliphaticivorans]CAA0082908.1 Electron transport complex subunit RsxC [Zhongshania aliphaticivorans]CAA0083825.1 Electron transport complex subunit RsxC [Zhongshania aliphaticivorans]
MRQIWDIHGGIHPAENKTQSLQNPIANAGIPAQLILPLAQHIGAPASPIVKVGDRVLKGQMVAEAKGFVSAPVHAPTSGVIAAITSHVIPHPSGMSANCIIIDTDGQDEWADHQGIEDYTALSKLELVDRIRQAGIAGMGGAGFPSAVKLSTRDDKPIETLILNGTECEPYITADDILMRERAAEIIAGAQILRHIIKPNKETIIGVEDNKPEGITALKKAAEGTGIDIVVFPTKYPSGGEKQLIQILTGKEVPSGGLPSDVGIVCQNIGTATAIYRAIQFGEPLISRITTVTGNACQQPQNYEVLLGTPVQYLLDKSDFQKNDCIRLIMGGPMMGYTLQDTAVPIVKTSNCVLAPTVAELPPPPPAQACIRCGMCAEACPVSLLPQQMYWFSRAQEHEKLEDHQLFDCIECGACSYVCPSNIPLVQYYRASKAEIRQAQQDKIKAERSKERFEARTARLEQEAAEKEARRTARMEAAKAKAAAAANTLTDANKSDVIQAAIERNKAKKAQTVDPAQAAIARAQAKRDGNAEEETPEQKTERLQKLLASAEKRLAAAKEKLTLAQEQQSDNADAFATAVSKTEEKLTNIQKELAEHQASLNKPKQEIATDSADPAQAAIARALAKRAGNSAEESDADKTTRLQNTVASITKRLASAQQKLSMAQEQGDENIAAFTTGVDKTQAKLDAAKKELRDHQDKLAALTPEGSAPEESAPEVNDPVQAAIERAKAARDAQATMSDTDKLKQNITSLENRIARTQEKLDTARANNDDKAEILADSLAKLEEKLDTAQQQLS